MMLQDDMKPEESFGASLLGSLGEQLLKAAVQPGHVLQSARALWKNTLRFWRSDEQSRNGPRLSSVREPRNSECAWTVLALEDQRQIKSMEEVRADCLTIFENRTGGNQAPIRLLNWSVVLQARGRSAAKK